MFLEGIAPWQRDFVGREVLRDWMTNSIENAKNKSVIMHIHGIGGIGKSSLLGHWNKTIDESVFIDCVLLTDLDAQVGHLVRSCKSKGYTFPRFDLLWSIRTRVLDGAEPAMDDGRKWLVDAITLVPVVGGLVDIGSKLFGAGKKLRGHLRKEHGQLHDWLQKELGKSWEQELIQVLWKKPNEATLLLMNAMQSDLNERAIVDSKTLVVLIDNVDTFSMKTRRWDIDGHPSNDVFVWQRVLSGVESCVGVTAGRDAFDENLSRIIGLEQLELAELDLSARKELFESRGISDPELRKSVDRICKGHPFMMQLVMDAIQKFKMTKTDLDNITSESLDEVRFKIWHVFFSRIGQLSEVLDIAALIPFFNKDILSVVYPKMKTKDWVKFQSISFVKREGDGYWSLHDLARELVIAEFGSHSINTTNDVGKLLIRKFRDSDDALYYGLSVSLQEFISEESAIDALNMMIVNFRSANKRNYILRAIEGVRFRSDRLLGHLEITKGNALMEINRFSEAESHVRNALAIRQSLPSDNPYKQEDIAFTMNILGTLLGDIGRSKDAEQAFQESLRIRRKLVKADDFESLSNVAQTLSNLGRIYSMTEQLENAIDVMNESKEIYMKLVEQGQTHCYPVLAGVINNLGILQVQMGQFNDAERSHLEALKIRAQLASEHPYYKSELVNTLVNLGGLKSRFGQYEQSKSFLVKALEELESLRTSSSDPSIYNPDMAMILSNLSQALAKTSNVQEAKKKLIEAVNIYRELVIIAPEKYNGFLANVLTNLSMLHLRLGDYNIADKHSKESLDIFRKMAQKDPQYKSNLAHGLILRGNVLSAKNAMDDAKVLFKEAIDLFKSLSSSDNHRLKFNLSCAYNGIATIEMKLSKHNEAVQMFTRVLLIRRDLADAHPTVYSFDLAKTLTNIGESFGALKRIGEAETAYHECIAVCTSAVITSEISEIAHHTADRLYRLYIEDMGMTKEEAKNKVQVTIKQSQQKILD